MEINGNGKAAIGIINCSFEAHLKQQTCYTEDQGNFTYLKEPLTVRSH